MNQNHALDHYDIKILRGLAEDGRVSWRDLAEKIGLSLTPTLRRVRHLEEQGYIKGYTATLDERRLKGAMVVFISVTLERQSEEFITTFERIAADLPEIMSGFLMTGGTDYLLRAVVRDLDHYQGLLAELIRCPGVAHIQSSFAIKAFINRPAPILAE
jgi:Lrp/AsnC family leucine-responsive transcriptional regulator